MVILLRMLFNGDLQPLGCSPSSKLYTTRGYMLYVCTFTADSSLQRMKTRRNKKDPNMYIRPYTYDIGQKANTIWWLVWTSY